MGGKHCITLDMIISFSLALSRTERTREVEGSSLDSVGAFNGSAAKHFSLSRQCPVAVLNRSDSAEIEINTGNVSHFVVNCLKKRKTYSSTALFQCMM